MEAIVLAAGEGSRLRPFTAHRPKPMIRAANKPIVQHAIEALVANGVRDITMVLGYHRETVQTYFRDGSRFGARIRYAFQDALTGTAQALAAAPAPKDNFLLLGGDNVIDASLVKRLLAAENGPAMVVHRSDMPSKYGVVTLDGQRITRIVEKPRDPRSEWVNTGMYRLTPDFHARASRAMEQNVFRLTDVVEAAIQEGVAIRAVRSEDLWSDAVYPWDLLRIHEELLHLHPPAAQRIDGVHIDEPVLIGDNVTIGPNVVLGAGTVIGNNVHIGANSVLESCVVYDDVQIAPFAYVKDAIVGEGCRIGPRFTVAGGPCSVRVRDEWHDLESFGAVLGEDCQLGANVTLLPGTILGNRVRIATGKTLAASVEDGAIVQ